MIQRDKHLWVFNAGMSFTGNPKWLFMYIVNHRPDIKPVWLCYDRDTLRYVRRLGYRAYMYRSAAARRVMKRAGVYVVNQVKEVIQPELKTVTMLNLWHGVGCKAIETKVERGFLNERLVKKHIDNKEFLKNNMLFLVTSPLMEKHFVENVDLEDDKLIRAGYPCCFSPDKLKTFNHDIRAQKGMSSDCKIAVYSPTFRDGSATDFFGKAIPDMARLVEELKRQNMLLIFKMHPMMENDHVYRQQKRLWADCPNLLFWDNSNDIYEIFDQVDMAVIDYSSIFYDMLAHGVRHFVRYMFDIDDGSNLRDFVFDVKEMTCGKMCSSFDELLAALGSPEENAEEECKRIYDLFWQYADGSSMDDIIDRALQFEPQQRTLPTLYSYDVFDTVIRRSCLSPHGVFEYVRQKMLASDVKFPQQLLVNYKEVRRGCEANARDMWYKTMYKRAGDHREITFDMIFERLQSVFGLTDQQTSLLREWELEGELATCIPFPQQIEQIKQLKAAGETVILISDMYLPVDFVKQLLAKADPVLADLPLMLSSDIGTQKTTKKLYADAYHRLGNYNFGRWIHHGDNQLADKTRAEQMGIQAEQHTIPQFGEYEQKLIDSTGTYDAYCAAALLSRFKEQPHSNSEIYAYCHAALYLVPYVGWALADAVRRGLDTIYFISRDGHHLKRIADEIIAVKGYKLNTKYIYGSRKAWRVPSQIDDVDDEFFSIFGHFGNITTVKGLRDAIGMTDEQFDELLPELAYVKQLDRIKSAQLAVIRTCLSRSRNYREFLMQQAEQKRQIVLDYLRQEIDFNERFAFVEFWGRGYTQDCLGRLLDCAAGKEVDNIFYYMRSICFDDPEHHIYRPNCTTNPTSLIFSEAVFANLHYRSVSEYERVGDRIEPVIVPCDNDKEFADALERLLPQFARDLYSQPLLDEGALEKSLIDFALRYYNENQTDPCIVEALGHLKDSVTMYGKVGEFAPPITLGAIVNRMRGMYFETKSVRMSMARSSWLFAKLGDLFYNKFRWDPRLRKLIGIIASRK